MSKQHSPAITYPLQSSPYVLGMWGGAMGLSATVLVLWWWLGAGSGTALMVQIGVSSALWLLCGRLSWHALGALPQGVLRWDGCSWCLTSNGGAAHSLRGSPVALLDLQSVLVLAWVDERARKQYFVLQRAWAPYAWSELRRAVYSLAHPTQDDAVAKFS